MALQKSKTIGLVTGDYWVICPVKNAQGNSTSVFALLYEDDTAFGDGDPYLERVELGSLSGQYDPGTEIEAWAMRTLPSEPYSAGAIVVAAQETNWFADAVTPYVP